MVDETEQSAPVEAVPATEAPAAESASSESVATDQAPEASIPVPDSAPSVVMETTEPALQSLPATPGEPAPASQQTATSAPRSLSSILPVTDLARRGLAARRDRKKAKLRKILEHVKKEGAVGSKDVQKYLHVSDSAATDYLNELVKRGALKRDGPRSRARYEIVN